MSQISRIGTPNTQTTILDTSYTYPTANITALQKVQSINGGSLSGFKNKIIGGDFSLNPWQRGTSFASIASASYCADRWAYGKSGTMVHTIAKTADAPTVAQAGYYTQHCLDVQLVTPDTSIAAGDYSVIYQNIEGYNFAPLWQRQFGYPFFIKAHITGTYCVAFRNSNADRSYVAEYSVNVADTWEFKYITVPPSPSSGTWDLTNGVGLAAVFCLAGGSTFQTTPHAWQTGNYFASSNQVNGCNTGAGSFKIALPQLIGGDTPTAFEPRSFQDELRHCYRYFYYMNTEPLGTALNSGALYQQAHRYPAPMRATPTVTGQTFAVNAGSPGTASIGLQATHFSASNTAANWTTNAIVSLTASFSAEL